MKTLDDVRRRNCKGVRIFRHRAECFDIKHRSEFDVDAVDILQLNVFDPKKQNLHHILELLFLVV